MPAIGLRLRLVIPLACVLIAYGGLYTYLAVRAQRTEILNEATQSTLRLAKTARRTTRHAMLRSRREDVHEMIKEIGAQKGIEHVRIFNKEGMIMYSADRREIHRVVDRKAEACFQCHEAAKPLTKLTTSKRARVFDSEDGHRTLAAIDVIYNEPSCSNASCHVHPPEQKLLGVLDIGVSLEDADQRIAKSAQRAVLFGGLSTFVICCLAAFLIHRLVNRPVGQILDCTRKVAQGDLSCTLDTGRDDEIGVLARSFCNMTADLRKARIEQSNWSQKLAAEVEHKTRDLKLAQAQVMRSDKLSSVGLLAAGVAHELNSPLTGILTYAHLVAQKLPDESAEKKDMHVIVTQAERCATIIRQLLDFSREHSPEKKHQDLHTVLEQAIALVEHQARFHNTKIERDFAPNLPPVLMDIGQMQQVVLNLLVNASEAMPEGGVLTVATRWLTQPGGDADSIQMTFRDTGIGIPAENISRVFDPFFTSKDVGKGTGLGLAVSYGIIERHGGTIVADSTLGEGSVFTITLPLNGQVDRPKSSEVPTREE